jgi:hypothetical protein
MLCGIGPWNEEVAAQEAVDIGVRSANHRWHGDRHWAIRVAHSPGHKNFDPLGGKSILTADPADLSSRAGTGTPLNKTPLGTPGSKEVVAFGSEIDIYIKDKVGPGVPTSRGIIHYGTDGMHIVPAPPHAPGT